MMIDRLKQAFSQAEQLSPEEQEVLAELLLQEMKASERWNSLFADPRSQVLLGRLVDEALAEDEAGETEEIVGMRFFHVSLPSHTSRAARAP